MSSFSYIALSCILIGLSWLYGLPWIAVCVACCFVHIASLAKKYLNDPYFIDIQSELNERSTPTGAAGGTEWINMGYWKVRHCDSYYSTMRDIEYDVNTGQNTRDFPTACEGLCVPTMINVMALHMLRPCSSCIKAYRGC